jgi:hypothetical protein
MWTAKKPEMNSRRTLQVSLEGDRNISPLETDIIRRSLRDAGGGGKPAVHADARPRRDRARVPSVSYTEGTLVCPAITPGSFSEPRRPGPGAGRVRPPSPAPTRARVTPDARFAEAVTGDDRRALSRAVARRWSAAVHAGHAALGRLDQRPERARRAVRPGLSRTGRADAPRRRHRRTLSADPAMLRLLIDDLGPWLAAEYTAVHGAKAPRPGVSLRDRPAWESSDRRVSRTFA